MEEEEEQEEEVLGGGESRVGSENGVVKRDEKKGWGDILKKEFCGAWREGRKLDSSLPPTCSLAILIAVR